MRPVVAGIGSVAESRQLSTQLATCVEDAALHGTHRDAQFLSNFIVVKSLHEHIEWDLKFRLEVVDGPADILLINHCGYSVRLHRS